jgi:hypothetical protein
MFMDKISIDSGAGAKFANGYLGGANRTSSDHPFLKGYFYVFFSLPSTLFKGGEGSIEATTARDYMLVSAEDFTPPGDRQLNTGDIQGQGGVDSSFLIGQTIAREFSIQYKDYWGAPIFRIHKLWSSYIDPYLGASTVADTFGADEYKGTCMVIQTKPIAGDQRKDASDWKDSDIIKIDYFDGVQTLTDLKSAYGSNITDNTFVKPVVQYKFDGFPLDETNGDVRASALAALKMEDRFKHTQTLYSELSMTVPTASK